MDAVKYVKTLHRLCKSQDGCFECILDSKDGCIAAANRYEGYENAVPIVEQWAKEHPVKTRQSEFLKMFPNAKTMGGVIAICPNAIDSTYRIVARGW
jgi:hypothetical protein